MKDFLLPPAGDAYLLKCGDSKLPITITRGLKVEHPHIRRILQQNWELQPVPASQYYTSYLLRYDGTIDRKTGTGRYYTLSKQRLNEIMLV